MSVDHASRSHSQWSASSTARNVHCAGALALAPYGLEQKESIDAARGTAAHEIAEQCLRSGKDGSDFIDTVVKTKEHEITIDDELAASAQVYVDYVRGRMAEYKTEAGGDAVLQIEQRFHLTALDPPFDAGGTGDAVIYFPLWKLIEVVDLKNGRGYVDEKKNPQLRTYGLGTLLENAGLDIEQVQSTIVQPRLEGRRPVRSETLHVSELIEWTAELLASMNRSKQAAVELAEAGENSVLVDEWVDRWLVPGKCKWCAVEGSCPALRKSALEAASVWLDDLEQPRIANAPGEMSPEKLGQTLDLLEMIENWIKAVRAHAHTMAEHGATIPGYQLVEKIGNRKWAADEAKVVADLKTVAGLTDDEIYDRKVRSVAQIEKVLGAKRKDKISNMWMRPVTGTNLASTTKSTRPAVKSKAEQFLETEST